MVALVVGSAASIVVGIALWISHLNIDLTADTVDPQAGGLTGL
jgi:hypothetical protein